MEGETVAKTNDPVDKLATYRFILSCVWNELSKKSMDCDACSDVDDIKRYLQKLCSEHSIVIKLDKN